MAHQYRIATDVGGTFTDLLCYRLDAASGELLSIESTKVDTTPPHFEQGVLDAVERLGLDLVQADYFVHGSTVVINALTERRGAKTALITTAGFRDVLEIGRGARPDFFNLRYAKPTPFVPRYLRRELPERINFRGEVIEPLNLDALPGMLDELQAEGVTAVAISFLHAYAFPRHEQAALQAVRAHWPEVNVTASHEIIREWREYERTNTTVLSAYVKPVVSAYLRGLEQKLRGKGLKSTPLIMQSNGGIDTIEAAITKPISLVESGPSSGVLAAASLGKLIDEHNVIAFDVGGTTAKCSLIENGNVRITTQYMIEKDRRSAGYPIMTPVVDIVEIGSGGGSIAWVDAENKLHVGPESAGAVPGPAAYGKGGNKPTTTDANLLTRRINPEYFMGGERRADMRAVEAAFASIARPLGLTIEAAARGVIRVANNNMANALKLVSVNRGYDPREFTLIAFGGGGALHAAALAEELRIPKVIIPIHSSVFSAWGMLMSDLRRDHFMTRPAPMKQAATATINQALAELEQKALAEFGAEGIERKRIYFERACRLRYQGQEHTITIELPAGEISPRVLLETLGRFHDNYRREYSYTLDADVELVGYHVIAFARIERPQIPQLRCRNSDAGLALKGRRHVDFDLHGILDTPVYDRERLGVGASFTGPAVIEEKGTTTIVLPGQKVCMDLYGNIVISIAPGAPTQE